MPRPIGSASISFGLVNIPVQIYAAVQNQRVSFNMLHKECGHPVKQRMFCPIDNVTVDRGDIVRGFEHSRDQYVTFSEEELKAMEAERTGLIELVEFVPEHTVDLLYVESSHFLGPDKNGAKPYALLARALTRGRKFAVGRHGTRGKEHLVIVRAYKGGLVLHQVYYQNEVRSFDDAVEAATFESDPTELDLAMRWLDQHSAERFDASKYNDTWRVQVKKAVEEKIAGQEVTVAPAAPRAQIIDLLEALKRSVAGADTGHANEAGPPSSRAPGPVKASAKKRSTSRKSSTG